MKRKEALILARPSKPVAVLKAEGKSHKTKEELEAQANMWEMSHGGISGRTAQQFINYLAGKGALDE